jgi:hypothetical protein
MAYREPPATQKEINLALWHTVIGTNGDGLVAKVEWMMGNMATKGDIKRLEKARQSTWLAIKDIVLVAVAILGVLSGLGIIGGGP